MSSTANTTHISTTAPSGTAVGDLQHSLARGARIAIPALLLALALAIAVGIGTTRDGATDVAVQQGAIAGLADGWYQPAADTTAAVTTVSLADAVPLQQGTTPGMVDGWYEPGVDTVSTDTAVRQGSAPGMVDGWYEPGVDTGAASPTYPVGRVR